MRKYIENTNDYYNTYDSGYIDLQDFDLLQDRDMDEKYSNGIWDLSNKIIYELHGSSDERQEIMYNFLQDYKEAIITQLKGE